MPANGARQTAERFGEDRVHVLALLRGRERGSPREPEYRALADELADADSLPCRFVRDGGG